MGSSQEDGPKPSAEELLLKGLSEKVSEDPGLRYRALKEGTLFRWADTKRVGIINLDSAALNSKILEYLVHIWVPQNPNKPKTIPAEAARYEAMRGGCH